MKTFVAVLSLFSYFYLSLSLPLSQEKLIQDKTTDRSLQIDTDTLLKEPINLSTQGQSRKVRDLETEIISVLAQTLESLSRDAESEDVQAKISQEPLDAEDLRAQNPLLRDSDVVVIQEELTPLEKGDGNTEFKDRDENTDFEASILEDTTDDESKTIPRVEEEKEEEESVPKETKPFENVDDKSLEITVKEGIERSYKNDDSSRKSDQVAVFPSAPEGAIPILLNCAPDVVKGHLTTAPSYRTLENDLEDKKIVNGESKHEADNFTDAIDLNSPASIISRRRRELETGVTHYKVSEDFPESQGNHHLVSADYPVPNMVKITNYFPQLNK